MTQDYLEPHGQNQNDEIGLAQRTNVCCMTPTKSTSLHLRTQGRKIAGTSGVSLKAAGSMAASIHSWKKVACQRPQMHGRVTVQQYCYLGLQSGSRIHIVKWVCSVLRCSVTP